MAHPPRRVGGVRENAEAAFKRATTKPVEAVTSDKPAIPSGREMVTLRVERDVLEHFQAEGPGWQDRMVAALRKAAGL